MVRASACADMSSPWSAARSRRWRRRCRARRRCRRSAARRPSSASGSVTSASTHRCRGPARRPPPPAARAPGPTRRPAHPGRRLAGELGADAARPARDQHGLPAREVRDAPSVLLGSRAPPEWALFACRCSLLSVAQQAETGLPEVTSTLETQPPPPRNRPAASARSGSRSSAPGSPACAWPSPSGAAARPTSSSSSGPTRSAAPGATTPIPAPPATCSPTSTRSPSRRTPTGRALVRGGPRSRPTWRASDRCDVRRHYVFGADVVGRRWDDAARRWHVETAAGEFRAQVVVSAAGAWPIPCPDIPGLDSFRGPVMHSARWDHSHDLRGKRVAVIGTGACAIQVVPAIQPVVAASRSTSDARLDRPPHRPPGKPLVRRAYRLFPGLQKAIRGAAIRDARVPGRLLTMYHRLEPVGSVRWPNLERRPRPELRTALTPDYTIGCKRILITNDCYPAVAAPNAELVTSGIAEVRPHSIVTRDGLERPTGHDRAGHGLPRDRPADRTEDLRPGRTQPRPGVGRRHGDQPEHDGGRVPEPVPAGRAERRRRPHLDGLHDRVAAGLRHRRPARPWRPRAWRSSRPR